MAPTHDIGHERRVADTAPPEARRLQQTPRLPIRPPASGLLYLDVSGDFPPGLDCRIAASIRFLRRIFHLEFGKVERDVLREPVLAPTTASGN